MTAIRNIFCCLILLIAAQWLAIRVEAQLSSNVPAGQTKDPLYQLIGSAKEVVGDSMVLKAEAYFHGGTNRDFSWEDEEGREREGAIEEDSEHLHEAPAPTDWPAHINSRIQSHEHYHLKQSEQKEILPFLFMATQLDPYHIEAQLSTAYWLERRLHRPAEALQVLEAAHRFNPGSWEIPNELGNLYWRAHAYEKAIPFYEEALSKTDLASATDVQLAHLHYYLANAYESVGKAAKAREHYEIFLKRLPLDQSAVIRRQVTQKLESLV